MNISEDDTIKAMNVHWNRTTDSFGFKLKSKLVSSTVMKRSFVSKIAAMFHLFGLLSPITVAAKLIKQEIWKVANDRNEHPPLNIIDL